MSSDDISIDEAEVAERWEWLWSIGHQHELDPTALDPWLNIMSLWSPLWVSRIRYRIQGLHQEDIAKLEGVSQEAVCIGTRVALRALSALVEQGPAPKDFNELVMACEEKDRDLVSLLLNGVSQLEIADMMYWSQAKVSQMRVKAVNNSMDPDKLAAYLEVASRATTMEKK
jgi:hypothetical protein